MFGCTHYQRESGHKVGAADLIPVILRKQEKLQRTTLIQLLYGV